MHISLVTFNRMHNLRKQTTKFEIIDQKFKCSILNAYITY